MKGGVVMRIDRIKLISEMARQSIKVNDLAKKLEYQQIPFQELEMVKVALMQ